MLEPAELGPLALYVALGALVFAESGVLLGFFLPGDTVLFAAGVVAGTEGSGVSLPVLVAVVLVAAVAGDAVGYWTGRKGGPPLLRRKPRLAPHVERAERFYDRYGALAVVVARWIPWVRTLTPVLAGVAGMPYGRFLVANVVGAVCWGAGLLSLGALAARDPALRNGAIAVGVAVAAVSTAAALARARRARRR